MNCRFCRSPLDCSILDLGTAPPSNAYICQADLNAAEIWYPLEVMLCTRCWLVQLGENVGSSEMFSASYAYFSSTSKSFVAHAELYVKNMLDRFDLGPTSLVAEVASNDGYLLQHVLAEGVPCYGIEPTASTAAAARKNHGLDVVESFFGEALAKTLAKKGRQVDLVAANNVLAHVPDIRDFMAGFRHLLKPHGVATFEFPSVTELVHRCAFDTIYHEHYSYLSLSFVQGLAEACSLRVFDVETLEVHGGSLRVYVTHQASGLSVTENVTRVLADEAQLGVESVEFYKTLAPRAFAIKDALLDFLIEAKSKNKSVVAYGAAAKGNTMLNLAGIKPDLLPFVVDGAKAKQGKYLPGSRIPVFAPEKIAETRPDYLLILPWNIRDEIMDQQSQLADWGGKFVTAVPKLSIIAPRGQSV